mmetsp:Transcript_3371/g.6671  ORF Transcript_3371/g.6671 Transcript_3371/m.6671 type:complete len:188 (+) Transcript_3371:68-631(+)
MSWIFSWLGEYLSSFLSGLGLLNKEASILIVGLDNAGKSTLMHRLAKGSFGSFPPTEKPSCDEFQAAGVKFKAWDLGGHEAVRQVWDDFFPSTDAMLFIVDAADADRLAEARDELSALAVDSALFNVPIAVLFNKNDLPFALSNEELDAGVDMRSLALREGPVKAFRISVLKGTGYSEALQWIAQHC